MNAVEAVLQILNYIFQSCWGCFLFYSVWFFFLSSLFFSFFLSSCGALYTWLFMTYCRSWWHCHEGTVHVVCTYVLVHTFLTRGVLQVSHQPPHHHSVHVPLSLLIAALPPIPLLAQGTLGSERKERVYPICLSVALDTHVHVTGIRGWLLNPSIWCVLLSFLSQSLVRFTLVCHAASQASLSSVSLPLALTHCSLSHRGGRSGGGSLTPVGWTECVTLHCCSVHVHVCMYIHMYTTPEAWSYQQVLVCNSCIASIHVDRICVCLVRRTLHVQIPPEAALEK